MSRETPEVTAVATNSLAVYLQVSTGKGEQPATVRRGRSSRVGRDGFTFWCASCGTNDACEHTRCAEAWYAEHRAELAA
jgi:hypothetical protein